MRILYLTRGLTSHDRRFLRAFASHGVETGFLALEDCSAALAAAPLPSGARLLGNLGLPPGASTAGLRSVIGRYVDAARGFSPSLILAGPVHDAAYLAAASRIDVPVVAQSWASDVFWETRDAPEAVERSRIALRAATAVFVDCRAVALKCAELALVPLERQYLMPWGLELDEMRPSGDQGGSNRMSGASGRRTVVCLRGMDTIYGPDLVLDTFRSLHRAEPGAALVWAADGPLRPSIEKFVRDNGLESAMSLPGQVNHDRVIDLLGSADCFLSCSRSDGTSVSLLEAMYAGVPIVVADIGGNREWIRSGDNGWLVDSDNGAAFARAISSAFALSQIEREEMARKNRQIVAERADWRRNFPGFCAFLSKTATH